FAISLFGTHDKIALQIGTVVLLAAVAALIGVLTLRHWWYGAAGIAAFGVIGVAAAVSRPAASATWALPSLIGTAAALGALRWLLPSAAAATEPATEPDAVPAAGARRRFLAQVGLVTGGAMVAGFGGRQLSTRRGVAAARDDVVLPAPSSTAPAAPAGADLRIADLAPYVTGNDDFYRIDTALVVPQVDPNSWRLRISGRVRKPLELTFAQLLARPMVERYITLCCVSNEVGGDLISNALWLGVPVKDLLDEAGPRDGADQVVSRSADGFTCGTPTAVLQDGRDAILAVGMNGEPLPVAHGFPVRMVVPGLYGYVSACKWIVSMELATFAEFDAYWIRRGWAEQGPIKTQSRIDVPRRGKDVPAGQVTVAGVAWAQHRGIGKVEVSVDRGDWHEATLADAVSIDTWRQWSWAWPAAPGRHTLQVRATDATGETQPGEERPIFPDGATGWDTMEVTVRG
ncbi:MAG TPA: molybdopterin-dependent oxidoreductase, partial [Micromonosporaceae bacterium]|nr:molybdopterin-dependent oxidoreductase [Micromonosporaceae bacterium]